MFVPQLYLLKKIKYLDNYYKENFDKYNNDDQGYLEFLNSNLKFMFHHRQDILFQPQFIDKKETEFLRLISKIMILLFLDMLC